MRAYSKITAGGRILALAVSPHYVRKYWNGDLIACDATIAAGVVADGEVFGIEGRKKPDFPVRGTASIEPVDAATYARLAAAAETEALDGDGRPLTREAALAETLPRLRAACREAIEQGVDVTLSDGRTHHFPLEIEDEWRIGEMERRATAGATDLSYHAAGEACRTFSPAEIHRLYAAMMQAVEKHTAYHNALKRYAESLPTAKEILAVRYGIPVSQP